MELICQNLNTPWVAIIVIFLAHGGFDAWAGKTEKISSGSLFELIFRIIIKTIVYLIKGRNKNG